MTTQYGKSRAEEVCEKALPLLELNQRIELYYAEQARFLDPPAADSE